MKVSIKIVFLLFSITFAKKHPKRDSKKQVNVYIRLEKFTFTFSWREEKKLVCLKKCCLKRPSE